MPEAYATCAQPEIGRGCDQASAVHYCDELSYGGHTDWRLPNIKEALTLFDPSHKSGLSPVGFPEPAWLTTWSSSGDPDESTWAFAMQGEIYAPVERTIGYGVRCVR